MKLTFRHLMHLIPPVGIGRRSGASLIATLSASVALALASSGAWAADPPAKVTKPAAKPAAAKPAVKAASAADPADTVLNREQLRACMAQRDKVRDQNTEAARQQADLEREKGEIVKDGEALKADLDGLDRTSPPAVEAYNARATARDQRIAAFEPKVSAFNAQVESLNTERASYKRDCENRKFDEKDEKALNKKP